MTCSRSKCYLLEKSGLQLRSDLSAPNSGFFPKATQANTADRRPSSSVFSEKGEGAAFLQKAIMIHRHESKNRVAAGVLEGQGPEQREGSQAKRW